ncbi:MAG: hypothetical protein WDO69_33360 [Pseudomonadota bacterium]
MGKTWVIALALLAVPAGGCAGKSQLVGSSNTGGSGASDDSISYTVTSLVGACLPEPILDEANCKLLTTRSGPGCSCTEPGLSASTSTVTDAVRKQMQLVGACGNDGQPSCSDQCVCEVSRAIGTSLIECTTLPQTSPDSSGWCYVSGDAGEPQTDLVADCPDTRKQSVRFVGDPSLLARVSSFLACADGAGTVLPRGLGEVCYDEVLGSRADFAGYSVQESDIDDQSSMCGSGVCVANHFQGLVSCPYGQAAGAGDCLLPGSTKAVSVAVASQLVDRQAAVASICSCHCAGPGPGPFCTCPDSMQCELLVEDTGNIGSNLAGSYCIPKGSEFVADARRTACVPPNCGVKHPY